MTQRELLKSAYAAAHHASDITDRLCFPTPGRTDDEIKKDTTLLLEQAGVLNCAAQELENISRGHPQPKNG